MKISLNKNVIIKDYETKTLQRKVTLYDKNIIQRKNTDW